jgi:hypothetical protein
MASSTSYSVVATTEEGADDESPSSSPRRPGDAFAEANALIPQQPQERGSLSQRLSEGLTWEDDYYNDKEDIVAVFDVDGKTVSDYHYSVAIKWYPTGLLSFLPVAVTWGVLSYVFIMVLYVLFCVFIGASCKQARMAKSAKIHMAVTSDCIQYDQESPDDHVMVSSLHARVIKKKRFEKCISHLGCAPSYYLDSVVQRGALQYCGEKISKVWMVWSNTVDQDDCLLVEQQQRAESLCGHSKGSRVSTCGHLTRVGKFQGWGCCSILSK